MAAAQGDADAQFNLGLLYGLGKGVPKNLKESYKWFSLASSREAGDKRDLALEFRDAAAAALTVTELSEAQRLAQDWKPVK